MLWCLGGAGMLNPLTPRVSYGDIQVILTSGSVDENNPIVLPFK